MRGVWESMIQILLIILLALAVLYAGYFISDLTRHKDEWAGKSLIFTSFTGLFANFLDTLGIGSFALVTIIVNWTDYLEDDRRLPGTLNVGNALPTILQALIFLTVIEVDSLTLVSLMIAAILGSLLGSRFVAHLSEKKVRYTVGIAMCLTGVLMILTQLELLNLLGTGNTDYGLQGGRLVAGIVGNFILGSLMSLGVGLYAPCMAMLYVLGLHPIAAYPIMMASCAGLMPVSGSSFIRSKLYNRSLALGLTLGGLVGVYLASKLVVNVPLTILKWLVIIVVFYAGISYIQKARKTVE